ncbi:hypothetical protein E2C01_018880 [Portunus trituberculatus]|uniref:Uncharacterized protein n=1 Tax=Portunus trituberculatus TaxID=210409 RepID=A0A5B7DWG5_PORTR|nr:hypothetical protein [Portunus trituberculatus]
MDHKRFYSDLARGGSVVGDAAGVEATRTTRITTSATTITTNATTSCRRLAWGGHVVGMVARTRERG